MVCNTEAAATVACGRKVRRPTAAANIQVKAAYIARLYSKLAGVRVPPAISALDSLDGFLWRKPNANQAWKREPVTDWCTHKNARTHYCHY
jgi:hypothetical protein